MTDGSKERGDPVTLHQLGVALGAVVATIVLAFWFAISNAFVETGQTEELLILVATVSMSWVCLDLIKTNHIDEDRLERWASRLPFVTEGGSHE